jgi:hypothetical protein
MEGGMTCDLSTIYETTLAHLIAMAKVEGFKAYAWKRAQALDEDQSGLFTGIAEALKAAMLAGQDEASASEGQSETKRP